MSSLTDRYLTAAVAGVPEPQRDDVAAELKASLADAVDALVAGGLSREDAERQALRDLGDPAILAEQYGGRPRHLIGPAYFAQYEQLLKTLLLVVTPIVGAASLLAQGMAGESVLGALLAAAATMFQVAVQIAFWVTVVFAFLERSHTPVPHKQWTPDDLPEVVDRRIGLAETVTGVAFLTVLMWAIIWQRDHWLVTVDGSLVPVVNPDAWVPWIALLLLVLLASIILEVVKYRAGHWTMALAAVNTVLNAAFAGIVLYLWNAGELLTAGVAQLVPTVLLTPLVWVIVAIAVFDTAEGWWSLRRSSSPAGIAGTGQPLH